MGVAIGSQNDNLTYLEHEPASVYHAKAQDYLSSHQLGDFRRSPLLYHKKKLGLIADEDRPAYLVGRALHTLVLEGQERFDEDFAVGGPVNPKTGQPFGPGTKAFAAWAEEHGKAVLTDAQYELVESMAAGVRAHQIAMELLASGDAEGVVRTEYCGVPCQIRMDWFEPYRGIVDLKTCDDLMWFEADARRYGYVYQMAFYRAVLRQASGLSLPVFMIAVEKREPFRCGVWKIDSDILGQAERENEAAVERLKHCQESGSWPTGYAEMRLYDSI